jgi:hypothetical protein
VTYVQEDSFTNAADTVAEGAAKPESAETFNLVTELVSKIAHFLPVTDEMLEDVAQLRTLIDNRLVMGVQLEEEDQLLNGDGTAPNISGILDRTGLQTTITVGADTAADAVYQMVTDIREAFYEPNGIVINPTDWGSVNFRLAKDGSDQYFAGGPFTVVRDGTEIRVETFWNLDVVVTPAIAAGTVLVGDFTQAQVFRKGGLSVEASNSHSDYFIKNKTAIRAEERVALAVYREAVEDQNRDVPLRVLKEVELFDVSPVTFPAYAGTDGGLAVRTAEELGSPVAVSLGVPLSVAAQAGASRAPLTLFEVRKVIHLLERLADRSDEFDVPIDRVVALIETLREAEGSSDSAVRLPARAGTEMDDIRRQLDVNRNRLRT